MGVNLLERFHFAKPEPQKPQLAYDRRSYDPQRDSLNLSVHELSARLGIREDVLGEKDNLATFVKTVARIDGVGAIGLTGQKQQRNNQALLGIHVFGGGEDDTQARAAWKEEVNKAYKAFARPYLDINSILLTSNTISRVSNGDFEGAWRRMLIASSEMDDRPDDIAMFMVFKKQFQSIPQKDPVQIF